MSKKPAAPPSNWICDVCGRPATTRCIDTYETDNYDTGMVEIEAAPGIRQGCDEHPVHSQVLARFSNLWDGLVR